MKITKEDKTLYNFLKIVYDIFGKTEYATTLVGTKNKLYFRTYNYSGKLEFTNTDTLVPFTFGEHTHYSLRLTPHREFVLLPQKEYTLASVEEVNKIVVDVETTISGKRFLAEMDKAEPFKAARVALLSGLAISDNDTKIINSFPDSELFENNNWLIIKAAGITDDDINDVATFVNIAGSKLATQTRLEIPDAEPENFTSDEQNRAGVINLPQKEKRRVESKIEPNNDTSEIEKVENIPDEFDPMA